MPGFRFVGTQSGNAMVMETFIAKNTETLNKGDMAQVDTGEVDLGATGDNELAGMIVGADDPDDEDAAGAITAVNSTTKLKVITNPDAIYSTEDLNARLVGALLDLTGATGAQGLAASSNNEFVVVKTSTATEETEVMIANSAHYLASK